MRSEVGGLPRTAQATVREHLRTRILVGELEPGSRLAQSDIAREMSVSITPVREALRDLSMEGLVDVDPFRGAVVHVPSYEEIECVFAIRQRLVPLAVELGVANITAEELEHCEEILRAMEASSDWVEWSTFNRDLHNLLDGASRNILLADILRQLSDRAALYVHHSLEDESRRRPESEAEHRDLVAAFGCRDGVQALKVYLLHFEGTLRVAREHLGPGPTLIAD